MNFLRSLLARFQGQPRRMQAIISATALVGLCTCCGIASAVTAPKGGASTTTAQQHSPTATQAAATPKPTATPQIIHYPPTTKADLPGLAAKGDASAIHEFHSETVGAAGVCPIPKREVIVDPSITGKQLAEDLLAYYYAQSLDNPCGSLVLAYHNQSEANDAYTAGRINLDVTDANGGVNLDPNGTNLTYTLTLDIGDVVSGQEYAITY